MERRNFLRVGGVTLTALALGKITNALELKEFAAAYNIKMLSDKCGVFTEQGGTILFLLTNQGLIVVDSQYLEPAQHLITELKSKFNKPFDLLINTHHHGDHTGGNVAFKGLVKHVVAHSNSAINQKSVYDSAVKAGRKTTEQLFPDLTFEKKWKYKAGDDLIKAYYFGAAHTNGDAMIHLVNENVVHMGDLVFNRRFPFIDKTAGANIGSWITVLQKAMKTFGPKCQYVFGHAAEGREIVGTMDDVKAFQNYLAKLLAFVQAEIKAGKSKEEILKATIIPGAEEWKGSGLSRSLDAAYEELKV